MKCKVDNPDAKVKWYHNGKEVKPSDPRFLIKNEGEFAKEGKDTTSCKLEMEEFQHAFTSQLQGKNVVEGETATFEIDVEEDDAPAKWYKDGVEIVPDGKRIQIVTQGKKRKLIIKDCKIDDTANITCKVPGDESSAPLNVAHHNGFKKGMRDFKQCVEREEIIFNVELKDPGAPANFFMNGEPVDLSDPRFEVKNLGDGKHQLIIKPVKMGDAGTVSCKTPSNKGDEILESKSSFNVIKGEEAPVMGDCGPA